MEINKSRKLICTVLVGIGLSAMSHAIAGDFNNLKINGVQYCSDVDQAVKVFKSQGYFDNATDREIQQIRKSGSVSAFRISGKTTYAFIAGASHGNGKIELINYKVKQAPNTKELFNKEKQLFEQATGIKLNCRVLRPNLERCRYVQGEEMFIMTGKFKQSKSELSIASKSSCK